MLGGTFEPFRLHPEVLVHEAEAARQVAGADGGHDHQVAGLDPRTHVLLDPEGKVVKCSPEKRLEEILKAMEAGESR